MINTCNLTWFIVKKKMFENIVQFKDLKVVLL